MLHNSERDFIKRHIGTSEEDQKKILQQIGYNSLEDLNSLLSDYSDQIQCVVSQDNTIKNTIPFGLCQKPTLYDYPDGIDVMQFITTN